MITDEQRQKLEDEGLTNLQIFWVGLCERKRCLYCKKKYPDGIVNKHPGETNFKLTAEFWFTGEYLFHVHETHGYTPDTVTMFLEEIARS